MAALRVAGHALVGQRWCPRHVRGPRFVATCSCGEHYEGRDAQVLRAQHEAHKATVVRGAQGSPDRRRQR